MQSKTDLSARVQPVRLESRSFLSVVKAAPVAADVGAASDLARLPGVGPGLVWKLQAAGIGSLGALAGADAGDLRRALGALSGLVDVDAWIAFARAEAGVVG